MQLVLDGQLFQVFDAESSNMTRTFVPTLRPINAEGKFDSSVFKEFDLGDRVKMYTLLMDGAPANQFLVLGQKPVEYQKGATLAITDKFFGEDYLITWQIYHGLAIAESPILVGVTGETCEKTVLRIKICILNSILGANIMLIILEGQQFEVGDPYRERRPDSFWPILRPLDSLGRLDYSVFGKRQSEERVMMYTLLMDGFPVDQTGVLTKNPPKYKKGAWLDITDKFFGPNYLISWRFSDGIAIASTPILYGTSDDDLTDNNLLLVQKKGDHVYGKR